MRIFAVALCACAAAACRVGDPVKCHDGNYSCAGNECCHDGTTCPSAPPDFHMCPKKKVTDCTVSPRPAPSPTPTPPAPSPTPPSPSEPCLCIFDIDRTLTGKQGAHSSCPTDVVQAGIPDQAYSGGILMLSELGESLAKTFCHKCFLGTISAGIASGSGSKERGRLYQKLSAGGMLPTSQWNPIGCTHGIDSPLVTGCADGTKQNAVPGIQQWYKKNKGADIADSNVYFFDDRSDNVVPFKGLPYNAHQISCDTRDLGNAIGLCGARLSEIKPQSGVSLCSGRPSDHNARLVEVEDGHYVNGTQVISQTAASTSVIV